MTLSTSRPVGASLQVAAWRLSGGPLWRAAGADAKGLLLRPVTGPALPLRLPAGLAAAWRGEAIALPEEGPDRQVAVEAVLDGALALETAAGPVSGPAAALALGLPLPPDPEDSPAMRRSLEALRLAALAPRPEPYPLTASLYFFGRTPCGPACRRRLPDAEAVARFLGVERLSRQPQSAAWFGPPRSAGEWIVWRRPAEGTAEKLYVAAALPALLERLPAIVSALAEGGASGFKLPASARGLRRPDRCVAYFPDAGSRRRAGDALAPLLADAPAEPVPFTVSSEPRSVLSWGRDPPRGGEAWRQGPSWRLWLCGLLARALFAAAALPHPALPGPRFALLRAALAGLDPASFAPKEADLAA